MIPPQLRAIAEEIASTGRTPRRNIRTLLSWFGSKRRGKRVVRSVRQALQELELHTEPNFSDAPIDSFVRFLPDAREETTRQDTREPTKPAADSNETEQRRSGEHDEQEDDPDGLGDAALWGDYPIDELLIRNETRTVHGVVRRIEQGFYVLDPEFQRDFIWGREKQSRLIESVIMRIPLPVFYFAEDDEGRMIVVDGLQRLSTFERFLKNRLKLHLPGRAELHKRRFSELGPKLKNRVEDCNLTFYIMDARVPERARLDIFERVNGGVPLTRQQMRNCLYMGHATRFLKEEAQTQSFLAATGKSLRSNTMRDREFINRFCAFQILRVQQYGGDMDGYLAETLKVMNAMTSGELEGLRRDFRRGLDNNYRVFGEHAFRKSFGGNGRRSVLNASLWDVMATGLSRYSQNRVTGRLDELRSAYSRLLNDEDFQVAITYATNDDKRVQARFRMAGDMLQEVLA